MPLARLPSEIRAFLASNPVETPKLPLISHHLQKSRHTPLYARLYERVGGGRTCDAWRADIESSPTPLIIKMISGRHVSSVIRESLFYEVVFPLVGLGIFVPQYYGTYASLDGGWYAIVLQDVGRTLATDGSFPEEFAKGVR